MNIKPIETVYKGYRFRSRLEARWATFFDALGIPWQYEKEGYDLGKAGLYLPDFWLPTVTLRDRAEKGLWIEIKGQRPINDENWKCEALAVATQHPVVLFVGLPCSWSDRSIEAPDATDNGYQWEYAGEFIDGNGERENGIYWDNCMSFMRCYNARCNHVKIEFEEGSYCECPVCHSRADDEHPSLVAAYAAARQVRFER